MLKTAALRNKGRGLKF